MPEFAVDGGSMVLAVSGFELPASWYDGSLLVQGRPFGYCGGGFSD